jgi:hypothetical protein
MNATPTCAAVPDDPNDQTLAAPSREERQPVGCTPRRRALSRPYAARRQRRLHAAEHDRGDPQLPRSGRTARPRRRPRDRSGRPARAWSRRAHARSAWCARRRGRGRRPSERPYFRTAFRGGGPSVVVGLAFAFHAKHKRNRKGARIPSPALKRCSGFTHERPAVRARPGDSVLGGAGYWAGDVAARRTRGVRRGLDQPRDGRLSVSPRGTPSLSCRSRSISAFSSAPKSRATQDSHSHATSRIAPANAP